MASKLMLTLPAALFAEAVLNSLEIPDTLFGEDVMSRTKQEYSYTPPARRTGLDRMDLRALEVWERMKDPDYYKRPATVQFGCTLSDPNKSTQIPRRRTSERD